MGLNTCENPKDPWLHENTLVKEFEGSQRVVGKSPTVKEEKKKQMGQMKSSSKGIPKTPAEKGSKPMERKEIGDTQMGVKALGAGLLPFKGIKLCMYPYRQL